MSTKIINIIGCRDHQFRMPNKLELTVGFHGENYLFGCSGCAARGFMWSANAPQPTFLTIANSQAEFKSITNYCLHCAIGALDRLKQDLVSREVLFCPCIYCCFETVSNPHKPKDLMNSPQAITICFCALSNFDMLGKLSQEITDYQKGEYTRKYRDLSDFGERSK